MLDGLKEYGLHPARSTILFKISSERAVSTAGGRDVSSRRLEQIRDKDAGVDKKPLTLRASASNALDERGEQTAKVADVAHLFISPDRVEDSMGGVGARQEMPQGMPGALPCRIFSNLNRTA